TGSACSVDIGVQVDMAAHFAVQVECAIPIDRVPDRSLGIPNRVPVELQGSLAAVKREHCRLVWMWPGHCLYRDPGPTLLHGNDHVTDRECCRICGAEVPRTFD